MPCGLPDIYGWFHTVSWANAQANSAFQVMYQNYNQISPGGGYDWGGVTVDFSASRHNSIYGSSDTVTPLSQKTNFLISY